MSMFGYSFPRTYADLKAAPWCYDFERPDLPVGSGDGCFIHIHSDWFPDDYGERFSACGYTLKDALVDLRELWDNYMRPPSAAMGDGARRIIRQHVREVMSMPKG